MTTDKRNLYRLDELSDYKVASHYSDVRDWDLIDADSNKIGKIDNLLVNKATERVVYLDVEVNEELIKKGHETYNTPSNEGVHEFLNKDGENHLIVPIGAVTIDDDNKKVVSNLINFDTFSNTNRFEKGAAIDRDYEVKILGVYFPEDNEYHEDDDDFYNKRHFNHKR
ncbi:hypothetical protein GCM10007424_01530 [Flavobacterium suaedae]|uniref:PRC-barrel domain-containing protein n=1 Tax=Flavobacterium suaedae TaxID=1767027 RepID=A0ABQ1JCG5_9FLAO|nr:PRC-barrel domain-containing protein [Flavobacterium suaedae]GGB65305.1 hypothetical protein GCM10007424_01530 [Flavobacterium suaedae]